MDAMTQVREVVESTYCSDSRRVLATLVRRLHDFDLAEEALQDAFATAMERWPVEGIPAREFRMGSPNRRSFRRGNAVDLMLTPENCVSVTRFSLCADPPRHLARCTLASVARKTVAP